jgi:hypothetical protein
MFWKSSVDEFYEKIEKNRNILNTIQVIVLEKDKQALIGQLVKDRKILSTRILDKINGQTLFKSKQNRESLYHAPSNQITTMRKKCEADAGEQLTNKKEIVKFLREFEYLKIQLEQRLKYIDYLKSTKTEIPVATIMEVMFNIVYSSMYTAVWGELHDEEQVSYGASNPDVSYEATL